MSNSQCQCCENIVVSKMVATKALLEDDLSDPQFEPQHQQQQQQQPKLNISKEFERGAEVRPSWLFWRTLRPRGFSPVRPSAPDRASVRPERRRSRGEPHLELGSPARASAKMRQQKKRRAFEETKNALSKRAKRGAARFPSSRTGDRRDESRSTLRSSR